MRAMLSVAVFLSFVSASAMAMSQKEWDAMLETASREKLLEIIEGRDRALDRLNRQVAQLTEMLSLEQAENTELGSLITALRAQFTLTQEKLQIMTAERDKISYRLNAVLSDPQRLTDEVTAALKNERDILFNTLAQANRDLVNITEQRDRLAAKAQELGEESEKIGMSAAITCGERIVTIPTIDKGKMTGSQTLWKASIIGVLYPSPDPTAFNRKMTIRNMQELDRIVVKRSGQAFGGSEIVTTKQNFVPLLKCLDESIEPSLFGRFMEAWGQERDSAN